VYSRLAGHEDVNDVVRDVAVATAIYRHPPYRPALALFARTIPTLDAWRRMRGVKTRVRVRMQNIDLGQQLQSPCRNDFSVGLVVRNRMVSTTPPHHRLRPCCCAPNRMVHPLPQLTLRSFSLAIIRLLKVVRSAVKQPVVRLVPQM
jgi:hypothetical protein